MRNHREEADMATTEVRTRSKFSRRGMARVAVATAAAGALVASGVAAHAALSGPARPGATAEDPVATFTGKGVTAVDVATRFGEQNFQGQTWTSVPYSGVTVTVPSGNWRLASSTFSGYTSCGGSAGQHCGLRIVARKSGTTSTVRFYPQADEFYAIDSVGSSYPESDFTEGHSLDRSKYLAPGTWRVWAQAWTSNSNTVLSLGSWHHRVMLFAR